MTSFPKVLILGQPFNCISGGGITLTNLFKGWPQDKIAVAANGHLLNHVTYNICCTYYQLGWEEQKCIFPFNLVQKRFSSGLKSIPKQFELQQDATNQFGFRYLIVNKFFYPLLHRVGLYHCLSKISLSQKFLNWLADFQPDIFYCQVFSREDILFAKELCDYLKIPAVVHMMDDWPSTKTEVGFLNNYWKNKIDKEFRELLDNVNLHLSICDGMSEEYEKRYNKKFVAFHNPLEIKDWLPYTKTNFAIDKKNVTILYSGRLGGFGIADSLLEFAAAIDLMNIKGNNIKLHVQTPIQEQSILNQLNKFKCTIINPFVEYDEIPNVFSKADILLIANDFSEDGIHFLKLSFPTKASEYMISGTPILVYASEKTAISNFFKKNDCGLCVSEHSADAIIRNLNYLIDNEEFRRRISSNAYNLAKLKFDAIKVREKFQNLLISVLDKNALN